MKLFILIAYIWNPSLEAFDSYVIDSGMAGQDCVQAMIDLEPIMKPEVGLACEFDQAQ